jgi:hypothetical protein
MDKFIIGGLVNVDSGNNECENKMNSLCVDMIYLLDKLRENGSIDEEEYQKHIYEKKKFLFFLLNS